MFPYENDMDEKLYIISEKCGDIWKRNSIKQNANIPIDFNSLYVSSRMFN